MGAELAKNEQLPSLIADEVRVLGKMHTLLDEIQAWFEARKECIELLAAVDTRVEGWFKAELLVLLHRLRQRGVVQSYDVEKNVRLGGSAKRAQVDFVVTMGDTQHFVELKALSVSQARGTPRNLKFYFRDDPLGLIKDFRKLDSIPVQEKWVLAFVYPSPSNHKWKEAVAKIPASLAHWKPLSEPNESKPFLFLSVWRSQRGGIHQT